MAFCTRIKTDRVLYDELLHSTVDNEPAIPIPAGEALPAGSAIDPTSTVTLTVTSCTPNRTGDLLTGTITFTAFIVKNIVITRPELDNLVLDFSFPVQFTSTLTKFSEAFISTTDQAVADCAIISCDATDTLALNIGARTISEMMTAQIMFKLVVPNDQIFVALCPNTCNAQVSIT